MRVDGKLTGFDIELFNEVSKRMGKSVIYNELGVTDNLISALDSNKNSNGSIAGITITKKREELCDFSHTYFRSGLLVLINQDSKATFIDNTIFYLNAIKKILPLFIFFICYTVLTAFLIYLFERKNPQFAGTFGNGLFDGWYWVNVVITTVGFGDKVPLTKKGKIMAVMLMWTGIFFMMPSVTASISSELTAKKLISQIRSKDDLKNKRVAVKKGTVTVDKVLELGSKITEVKTVQEGVDLLKNNKVDAVVHDLPAIKYAEQTNDGVVSVGTMFYEQNYGIALQQGSPLREQINCALLETMNDGTYEKIYSKYFGNN